LSRPPTPQVLLQLVQEALVTLAVGTFFATLAYLRRHFLAALSRRDPRLPAATFYGFALLWVLTNLASTIMTHALGLPWYLAPAILVVTSLPLYLVVNHDLASFWRIGLGGADRQIRKGIDYNKALRLCRSQLAFLGIGASKLTREEEFERAMLRCRADVPIRLLLSRPTHESLAWAAKHAGKDRDEYKRIVTGSLRRIALLRKNRGVNVEVRFFPDPPNYTPIFRLMFIDQQLCLCSYNVFGEDDGSRQPQLHVIGGSGIRRDVESFYYPFYLYFQWLWQLSDPWDFSSYLEDIG